MIGVNLIGNFFRRKLSCAAICFTFTALLAHVPAMVQTFVGFETNDQASLVLATVLIHGEEAEDDPRELLLYRACVDDRLCSDGTPTQA